MFDDRDFRELISDQKQVWEDRHVVMSQPMEDLDGLFDLNAARHKEKCSRRNERLMQRGELGRSKRRFGGHEIFPEEIGVLLHGTLERLKNHAAPFQIFRNDVALNTLMLGRGHAWGRF